MAEKFKEQVVIVRQDQLANGIYSMWIKTENIAKNARPGQFISIYTHDSSRLLPRPISICEISKDMLRVVYRVAGEGTRQFSEMKADDKIEVMGPLGNGYTLRDKKAVLIAGGIGVPPMLELAKQLKCDKTIVLGYRDKDTFLLDEFKKCGEVVIATEDGSIGTKGNVMDAIKEQNVTGEVIYSCGPKPMLKAVKEWGLSNNIETQISLEEKMACGIGACLACVCKTKNEDEHSHVHNARVCKDGPVFFAEEVEL
ncbi:MAG: dihydroorotate dehydrogenase electron transfer subunit [Lachnospiraceae bacterium]|nr:dihydroorotate dehydrogenase electron transfer subunit [Lachnospiraceae bacterium]MEE0958465.1 dihydroorotate dehydrogenase electron transfer subunit [Lachnospiraceae bacterium]